MSHICINRSWHICDVHLILFIKSGVTSTKGSYLRTPMCAHATTRGKSKLRVKNEEVALMIDLPM
jgi:hypothetical protein